MADFFFRSRRANVGHGAEGSAFVLPPDRWSLVAGRWSSGYYPRKWYEEE